METCQNTLGLFACDRAPGHPGACKAASGHWWAKFDSGRTDLQPFNPPPVNSNPTPDYRGVWV